MASDVADELGDIYAESSAVLRWLLGAPDAGAIEQHLASAGRVVTSALTAAEVARTLRRLVAGGQLDADARDRVLVRYGAASAHWLVYNVTEAVLVRAGEPFPSEPVRTLDAIHLATAAHYSAQIGPLTVISTDERIRRNAVAMGLTASPS